MGVEIQPIILTVPATGYLEFDIDIPWSIQNLTKYEMRFAQEKAGIIKGDYFPLFGFGYIDKGSLISDTFVVYNPDATGRKISLTYGEQNLQHSKVDSIVTSDSVPVTESTPADPLMNFHSGQIAGNVQVDITSNTAYSVTINNARYLETQAATPTVQIQGDWENTPYTSAFALSASQWNNLFQSNDHPFTIGPGNETILEVLNGVAEDTWVISGIEVRM